MGMIAFAIIPIPQKLALQDFPGGSVVKKKKICLPIQETRV